MAARHTAIGLDDYSLAGSRKEAVTQADKVAVIVASAPYSTSPTPGSIGSDSLAELIRKMRLDASVKASYCV